MRIILENDSHIELPELATAMELAKQLQLTDPSQAVAVCVNDKLVDLSTVLTDGDRVRFLHFSDPQGKEVFWHSSAHILAQAVLRIWPNAKPTIGPAIENGFYYDFADLKISEEDFAKIEKEIKAVIAENYETARIEFKNKQEAKEAFKANKFKCELIDGFEDNSPITAYRQGKFLDLCRGPHLFSIGKVKAIKLLKTSGAYWRGDANNEMLTRIYAISFPSKKLLQDHLTLLEEAKKRDHKILGPALDLFSLKEYAPGLPFIHPKGMLIWNKLLDYWRYLHQKHDYVEIKTPLLMNKDLWEVSGHWHNYRENMYTSIIEDKEFAIKPMNCPGCMLFYKSNVHSYRELPLRIAEMGLVHRYEPSGAITGLFRVRGFHQDDAHIFMQHTDIESEILGVLNLAKELYSLFELSYHIELSTKPEKNTIGSNEDWDFTTQALRNSLDKFGEPYRINEGDGAFYGPKIDLHIRDALNRTWQCGTIQLDMSLPERFELEYVSATGDRVKPIMIHRAIFGSLERFFGILIEHYAGKFPLWLSPRQVSIIVVADRHLPFAESTKKHLQSAGIICEIDASHESVSKKIRQAQLHQVNYILTVGDKEVENQTVSVRTRDNVVHGEVSIHVLTDNLLREIAHRSPHSFYQDAK